MRTTAIYPGSFNPIHDGHIQVINVIKKIFGDVFIVIAQNPNKPEITNIDERINNIKKQVGNGVYVIKSDKMVGRLAKELNAVIVKGARNVFDFQNELDQASFNRDKFGVETIIIPSTPELNYFSSSLIREMKKYNEQ